MNEWRKRKDCMEICIFLRFGPSVSVHRPAFSAPCPRVGHSGNVPRGSTSAGSAPMLPTLPCNVKAWRDELGRNGTNVPFFCPKVSRFRRKAPRFCSRCPVPLSVPPCAVAMSRVFRSQRRRRPRTMFLDVGKAVYNLRTSGEKRNFAGQRLCASRFACL